jgi:hypothetical protein
MSMSEVSCSYYDVRMRAAAAGVHGSMTSLLGASQMTKRNRIRKYGLRDIDDIPYPPRGTRALADAVARPRFHRRPVADARPQSAIPIANELHANPPVAVPERPRHTGTHLAASSTAARLL